MRFEKFEASDMRAALAAIKAALGPDAIIVATRELARGGLFRRPRIEVTAAVEGEAYGPLGHGGPMAVAAGVAAATRVAAMPASASSALGGPTLEGAAVGRAAPGVPDVGNSVVGGYAGAALGTGVHAPGGAFAQHLAQMGSAARRSPASMDAPAPSVRGAYGPHDTPAADAQQGLVPVVAPAARVAVGQKPTPADTPTDGPDPAWTGMPRASPAQAAIDVRALDVRLAPLRRELHALRGALREREAEPHKLERELVAMRQVLASLSLRDGGSGQNLFVNILEAADVAPAMRNKIVEEAKTLCQSVNLGNPTEAIDAKMRVLQRVVAQQLLVAPHFFSASGHRRVALVGDTGLGKTTTMAKIAAHAAFKHNQRVGLISLDTYRIGAEEQIGHYARLIGVPLVVAHDAFGFNQALQRFAAYDLVLIDTAGRSPLQRQAHRTQLAQLFAGHGIEVYLILAAATRWLELSSAMQDLSTAHSSALILTKLDEAVALGSCVNASHVCGLPIAFVTAGQRVPEDLSEAVPEELAAALVERVFEATRTSWAPRPQRPRLSPERPLRDQVA